MWIIYIVECSDHTYYTGIALDATKRIKEHNTSNKTGSKYVRYRRPVKLVYQEKVPSRSKALKREAAIKKLSHREKQKLIR
jgi:putative endonuclease